MNENLPQKYKDNVFYRILRKIRLFFKGNKIENVSYNTSEESEKDSTRNDMLGSLKVNVTPNNNEYEKRQFMKKLTDDPSLLDGFSIEKLKKILQYYLDENAKKKEKLKRINA